MYETVIGLEVHCELDTKAKAFCSCAVKSGDRPNVHTCPICMGLPGSMPKLNEMVVEYAVKMGIATNSTINCVSEHARKNYFYPDLPKGFQITQGNVPLCTDGYIEVDGRKIGIERIHIEEDAGKLIHTSHGTQIDYNRAGLPLIEIVTKPDLRTSDEARKFLAKVREILLYLHLSQCKMQDGNIRCDVNVSVRKVGDEKLGERCEMKNVNSFSGVVGCIEYERARQIDIIESGGIVKRETRRWIAEENRSVLLRNKESEADYRYFKEPDLPPIVLSDENILTIREKMDELPDEKRIRYTKEYNLTEYECDEVMKNILFPDLLDEAVARGANAKRVYNLLVSNVARVLNQTGEENVPFSGKELCEIADMLQSGEISSGGAKTIIETMFFERKSPKEIVKEKNLTQNEDEAELVKTVLEVLKDNEKSVADYKKGKTNAMGFIMGQCMRRTENSANPKLLAKILKRELDK